MMTIIVSPRRGVTNRRGLRLGAVLAGALLIGACDFDITNTNAPTVDRLTGSPTREVLATAATGIFANAFEDVGTEIQYYAIYGREGYNLDGNDPRETGEQIAGPQNATARNSAIWADQYNAIRTINTYLAALPNATGLTEAEVRASAGFAKTLKAWHFHRLAIRTGEYGIPIDVDREITEEPAPFVSFADAMAAVSALLDEAYADLQAAGAASFPFTPAPGFDGFDTPATFAQFNRALAAKVLVHRATFVDCATCWAEAAAALDDSFITDGGLPASLALGVYYGYTGAANEPVNPVSEPLSSNRFWVHPSIVTGAQTRADGSPDLRLTTKVMDAGRVHEHNDLVATHKPVMYNDPADPTRPNPGAWVPWITNEELLLLRAEIRWHNGDKPGAIADLDLVRQHAGGLEPSSLTTGSTDDEFIDELLYNRLYSLMWSQGTRWMDARRYDRLDELPIDREGDKVFTSMLVPGNECTARGLNVPCEPLTES
ncbi:MAG TPA: RagB/SusD family nutrient uptake outer membrane protein [Longimicrobiales bacterium]